MPALENMRHFETVADQRAKALDIWRLPLRSVLTALYLSADNLFTGGRFIKSEDT
jgi:hypothetical protein